MHWRTGDDAGDIRAGVITGVVRTGAVTGDVHVGLGVDLHLISVIVWSGDGPTLRSLDR